MAFQKSTLFWGKKIAPDNEYLPTGLQDAITPRWQTLRNLLMPILILGSSVAGIFLIKWYMGVIGPIVLFIIANFLSVTLPKCDSRFFKDRIIRDLNRRLIFYRSRSNEPRIFPIEEVIQRMRDADSESDGSRLVS